MLSGISVWSLLLIVLIVLLLFGSKKIKSLGSDLGEAIRGFRRSVNDDSDKGASDKGSSGASGKKTGDKNSGDKSSGDKKEDKP